MKNWKSKFLQIFNSYEKYISPYGQIISIPFSGSFQLSPLAAHPSYPHANSRRQIFKVRTPPPVTLRFVTSLLACMCRFTSSKKITLLQIIKKKSSAKKLCSLPHSHSKHDSSWAYNWRFKSKVTLFTKPVKKKVEVWNNVYWILHKISYFSTYAPCSWRHL